jgi:hypothetical protein
MRIATAPAVDALPTDGDGAKKSKTKTRCQ